MAGVKIALSVWTEPRSIEAYHWLYAQHLALGYYDHPGMIAWIIRASIAIFGDGTVGLRMLTIAGGALATWLAFVTGRRLYDEKTGALAAFVTGLAPYLAQYGSEASPDAPLLLFWAAAIWALCRVFSGDGTRWWYVAGAFFGLALNSKYSAVFIGAGTLLFLATGAEHRRWLRTPHPYLAAGLALAFFSPTIVWNAQNGWQSFAYQGVGRFGERLGFSLGEVLGFPGEQMLAATPFVFAIACWSGGRSVVRRNAPWQDRFLACIGIPVVACFFLLSFFRSSRSHWPGPAYVTLVILVAAVVLRHGRWGRRLVVGTVVVLAAAAVALPVVVACVPAERRTGWAQLADSVRRENAAFVVARDYHVAAQMGYHLRTTDVCDFTAVGKPGKSFRNWWQPERFEGRDGVVIWSEKVRDLERVMLYFDAQSPLPGVEVSRFAGTEKFELLRARRYRRVPR